MTGMRFQTALVAHGRCQSASNVRTLKGGYMSKLAKRDSVGVFCAIQKEQS
jgi:hypothetical protein